MAKALGPLAAFLVRIRAKRGHQIGAVARKLAVLVWYMLTKEKDYLWARHSLVAHKMRGMELPAGKPQRKGNKRGPACTYDYDAHELRSQEANVAGDAQENDKQFVKAWETRPPGRRVRGRLNPARIE